jgi:mannan endo-1,4-beta-mannosidase
MGIALIFAVPNGGSAAHDVRSGPPRWPDTLPIRPASYIGVYGPGVPGSYAGVTDFSATTGVSPRLVLYYSGWFEPFQTSFARAVSEHGAVPLVQINPKGVSLTAIAHGRFDEYLTTFARDVHAYGHPVILSFGHEMNGDWYPWGYRHESPYAFVAAWRHIVTLFRSLKTENVTWLWTVNVVHKGGSIARPGPWWPGKAYVTWVGLDGYYYKPSWKFASLFGPTIAAVRRLTHAPILIAETSAAPTTDQPAKIADLFAGIRLYGLLGFVWFDSVHNEDWRLNNPTAIAAFRQGARTYHRPGS